MCKTLCKVLIIKDDFSRLHMTEQKCVVQSGVRWSGWKNRTAYVGRVGKIERQDACRDASRDAVGVEGGWNVMSRVPTEVVKAVDWL